MAIATAVAGCVAFSMTKFVPLRVTDVSLVHTVPKFLLITSVTVVSYLLASYFLEIKEAGPVLRFIKKILFRNVK